jgi:two-component system nitrate/nitrite sensor histidine kinase NarX
MSRSLRHAPLAAKLGVFGALLLAVALGSIALTVWVSWQLEGGAAAVNEAGRLRMQTWRLAHAVSTQAPTPAMHAAMDASLHLLQQGDPARPLFLPSDAATAAALGDVQAQWQATRAGWTTAAPTPAQTAAEAQALVERVDALVARIETRLQRWTSLLGAFQLALMGAALATAVALLYASHLFVFRPLALLQQGLRAVEAGDLDARVPVHSHDEFGRVAEGFNRMAERLADSYRGLEAKVAEKTETLRAERERLAVLYDASRVVAGSADLPTLAQTFAQRLRAAAGADAVLVRCHDAAQGCMPLLASDGVPTAMLDQEGALRHAPCRCAPRSNGQAAVLQRLDRDANADATCGARPQCTRHGFAHGMTLPVRLQQRTLGEVTLLWRGDTEPAPAAEDVALLHSLASQLAGGIEALRAAALQREAAVSEERAFIARELHDSIAQALAFMKLQIQMLRGAIARRDAKAIDDGVGELDAGVRESLADVRELLLHFRTRACGDDLVAALRSTLHKFQHQSGIAAHLDVGGPGVPLAPDVQVQLLHVVQEALSNVRKHAGATQVHVRVDPHPDWRIEVRDDGCGFSTAAQAADGDTHVGLRIMRERAAAVGAQVRVHTAPGSGTRVVLTRPAAVAPTAVPLASAA